MTLNQKKQISSDTHDYDSCVGGYYKELLQKYEIYNDKEQKTLDQTKIEIIDVLNNSRFSQYKITATSSLNLIVDSINSIDYSDNIDSKELLVMVWSILCRYCVDDLDYFIEQLSDVTLRGPCVQGQTKRLLQVLICLID